MQDLRNLHEEDVQRLSTLASLATLLNSSLDLEPILQKVIAEVRRLLRADRGLLMVEDAHGDLQPAGAAFAADWVGPDGMRISRRIVDLVRAKRRPLLLADALEHPELSARESIRAQFTHSVLCAPLIAKDRFVGLLYLDSSIRAGLFTLPDLEVVRIIADMVASTLDRNRTFRVALENEKLALLGVTVAGILHELNNPLTVIQAGSELALMEEDVTGPVRETLTSIAEESHRCVEMLSQLLALTRRTADKPRRVEVDLATPLERVVRVMRPGLLARGVTLELEVAPDLPALECDPNQLIQVVMNLVTNAGHALAARVGGRITVSAARQGENLRIEVADNGPGVSPELQPRIFDAFFTTRMPGEGTGLGLYVCRAIARAHGGSLECENRPEGGAVFTLHIPLS